MGGKLIALFMLATKAILGMNRCLFLVVEICGTFPLLVIFLGEGSYRHSILQLPTLPCSCTFHITGQPWSGEKQLLHSSWSLQSSGERHQTLPHPQLYVLEWSHAAGDQKISSILSSRHPYRDRFQRSLNPDTLVSPEKVAILSVETECQWLHAFGGVRSNKKWPPNLR